MCRNLDFNCLSGASKTKISHFTLSPKIKNCPSEASFRSQWIPFAVSTFHFLGYNYLHLQLFFSWISTLSSQSRSASSGKTQKVSRSLCGWAFSQELTTKATGIWQPCSLASGRLGAGGWRWTLKHDSHCRVFRGQTKVTFLRYLPEISVSLGFFPFPELFYPLPYWILYKSLAFCSSS